MSAEFAAMHRTGTFLLVNVHDAGSAAIAQAAGAVTLGTTSSGHAYTLTPRRGRRVAPGRSNRTSGTDLLGRHHPGQR